MNISLTRLYFIATVILLTVLSWYYMVFVMKMNMEPVTQWSTLDVFMLFIMWSIMMIGMMLPSATPVFLIIENLNKKRKTRQSSYTSSLYFILGYLVIWFFFSLIITLFQWGLHYLTLLSPMMVSSNDWFTGILLISAGLYQFSSLKQHCLALCRSPLSFITSHWREGSVGAIIMGIKHGQYCLGCCWILMALLFVTGVMNLKWILILSIIVLIEKTFAYGDVIGKILGGIIISLGIYQLL